MYKFKYGWKKRGVHVKYDKLTMSAGPAEIHPRVSKAAAEPILYHYDPAFKQLHHGVEEKLKKLFLTSNDIIIMQGEAILGLEAAAFSCIRPGDTCLNLVTGVFGKWFEDFIHMYGGKVVEIRKDYNSSITPEEVRSAFEKNPDIKLMSVVHSETPSGTINPINELCPIAKEYGAITLVDSVSGVAGSEVRTDEWGIDICITGPQKCIGAMPGLSLMAVSPDAWQRIAASNPARNTFLSMLDWKEKWLTHGAFPYTPSVSLIYALNAALDMIFEEGLEAVWKRHGDCARACRAGLKAMGLSLWPESEFIATDCCTAFKIPEAIESASFIEHLRETYGVVISPGYGELNGALLRIGHMGHTAKPMPVMTALTFVGKALRDRGFPAKIGDGLEAALSELY